MSDEIDKKAPGRLSNFKFYALGGIARGIADALTGAHGLFLDRDASTLTRRNLKFSERPYPGVWTRIDGDPVFIPINDVYRIGGNKVVFVIKDLAQTVNLAGCVTEEYYDKIESELGEDYIKNELNGNVPVKENFVPVNPKQFQRSQPYNFDFNFSRRQQKDAIESREAIFGDRSKWGDAIKMGGAFMMGALAVIMGSSISNGENGGGGGLPNPGGALSIDYTWILTPDVVTMLQTTILTLL